MSTQRYISTSFWEDKWIRSLDPSERYLYLYLLTNPLTTIAGVYKVTIDRIAFDVGYDERTLRPMLERFARAKKAYFYADEWIIIPTWPKHQKWKNKKTIRKGIDAVLASLPKSVYQYLSTIAYEYPIDTVPVPYQYEPSYLDSDTDTDIDFDFDFDSPDGDDEHSLPPAEEENPEQSEKPDIPRLLAAWEAAGVMPENPTTVRMKFGRSHLDAVAAYGMSAVLEAITAYAEVVKSPRHYFKHRWHVWDFIERGLANFVPEANPRENYRIRATGAAGDINARASPASPPPGRVVCPRCGAQPTGFFCPACGYEGVMKRVQEARAS